MPITKSAKKALRGSKQKRSYNLVRKAAIKSTIKTVKGFVSTKSKAEAQKALSLAYQAIDKATKTGLIKKNNASRKKSRLAAAIRKIA